MRSLLQKYRENFLYYTLMLVFISINMLLMVGESYWFMLVPFVILIFWGMIYHPDTIFLFLVFCTPLSLKVDFKEFGVSIDLPTEPLLLAMMGLFFMKLVIDGKFDKKILRHPLTVVIIFNLAWILITAFSSSMFVVSIKFFISRLWYVVVFYFIASNVFMKFKNLRNYFILFTVSLVGVIIYSLVRHASAHWEQLYANYAPHPFFAGHGDYAAAICMFVPIIGIFIFKPAVYKISALGRFFLIVFLLIMLAGITLSFTRAAWIGMAVSLGVLLIMVLRVKWYTLAVMILCLVIVGIVKRDDIYRKLESNKEVSASNLKQHVESISNISTDVSNTERINRWKSAYRMFKLHPILGWGPGTYMFQYASFQRSNEMTVISTNTGNLGNAHSEYVGPLAEEGIFGPLSFLSIVLVSLFVGIRLTYRGITPFVRYTAAATILGLITYYVHGLINNYLDTDKAAVPFFASMAVLLVLDIYYNKEENRSATPVV